MAKQRRVNSRAVRSKPADTMPPSPARGRQPAISPAAATQPPLAGPPAPRPRYLEAIALYEQGVAALQSHQYALASSVFRSVLTRYPEQKELQERVRLYLNICDRHLKPQAASPSTPEERVFAATLAVNAGDFDGALGHLRAATTDAPNYDHALYMLASVLALRDQVDEAVPILLRAMALNPDNRALARHDPDLEMLRQHDDVRAALDTTNQSKLERRKPPRRR